MTLLHWFAAPSVGAAVGLSLSLELLPFGPPVSALRKPNQVCHVGRDNVIDQRAWDSGSSPGGEGAKRSDGSDDRRCGSSRPFGGPKDSARRAH